MTGKNNLSEFLIHFYVISDVKKAESKTLITLMYGRTCDNFQIAV